MHQIRTSLLLAVLLTAGLFSVVSCDPTFDVLQPSDQYRYSLYGVLDVAADTQVIRVDPLGSSSEVGGTSGFDATVVLRNRSSGEEIPLRDSLTTVVADSIRMHNFWTTHPIQPGTAYQIAVTKDGSDLTTATTTTPAQAPNLTVGQPIYLPCTFPSQFNPNPQSANTFAVYTRNAEHIAAVTTHYPILEPQGGDTLRTWVSRDHYEDVVHEGSQFRVSVFYRPELVQIYERINSGLESRECPPRSDFFSPKALRDTVARMVVAAGGPQWPEWRNASVNDLARPDSFSNVRGGHGFVGGVYTDTAQVPIVDRPPSL